LKRIPALDGLRAVAIAMVFAYHVDKRVVPAGYWGVILFFVLSGYLITNLLVAEKDHRGRIDLPRFYGRRALRLFPALIVVCLALVVTGTAWSAVVPALAHYANYARIAGTDLGLLTHTWFLAVLLHFYVVWPLVIAAVPARHRVRVVGGLALAAVAWRALAIGAVSPGWVYNATDTNAAAILAGCLLAVAPSRTWRAARLAAPALLALMFVPAFGESGSLFLWGDFVAIALAVTVVQDATTGSWVLERRAMVWLGQISYGLYLWHYAFVRGGYPLWASIPLTVTAATLSWYLVEEPVQRLRARHEARRQSARAAPGAAGRAGSPARGAGGDKVDAPHRAA